MVKLLSILLQKALEINKKISLCTIGIVVTQKINKLLWSEGQELRFKFKRKFNTHINLN